MKTILINCSPKKRFCASSYFIALQRLFLAGEKVTEKLRTKADHDRILGLLPQADAVVFCMPLYVDGIPSHVLRFLEEMEGFCLSNDLHPRIYCIANNGFIEGRQNEPLMRQLENFCTRAGLSWCGGVGIGGGVMLNVTRILFVVDIAILLLNMVVSGANSGNFFPAGPLWDFAQSALVLLFLNLGVLFYLFGMGRAMGKGAAFGKKYTRILVPSFVFILFADIFFIIYSTIKGGIFRGWLSRKQPDQTS